MASGAVFWEIVLAVVAVGIAIGAPLAGMNIQHRSESWEAPSQGSTPDSAIDELAEREYVGA